MEKISSYKLQRLVASLYFKRESLVHWLNADRPKGAIQRAVRLIEALHERNTLAKSGDKSEKVRRAAYDLHLEILKLLRPLRRTRWDLKPNPELSDGVDDMRGWHLEQTSRDDVGKVLELVASLSQYGLLDSVRRCHCGIWFLAYNRRNENHSSECKKASDASKRQTPEARKERANYMRKYRATPNYKKRTSSRRAA